jgi:hypothetical protein
MMAPLAAWTRDRIKPLFHAQLTTTEAVGAFGAVFIER